LGCFESFLVLMEMGTLSDSQSERGAGLFEGILVVLCS
jgi:hypothetical protein